MCKACGCTADLDGFTKVEQIKASSRHLRGAIASELGEDGDAFSEESAQLLKFHGVYQQEDRDRRKEARARGLPKLHMMMVRTRVPGGVVSADGYLAHDDIASRWGNGTLRLTTRQDFQLHGILKSDLRAAIRSINQALLTTLGGCGDQERNIMSCPAPVSDPFRSGVARALADLVRGLTPSTRAYHEIWIDGALVDSSEPNDETEPLYGEQYLPRKFKTALAIEGDNCVDVYANDLGLVARAGDDGNLDGFEVLVGGGLGRTHNKPDTFPTVAVALAHVGNDQAVEISRAIVGVQRDWGNRADRRHARLKYLVADRGLTWFRDRVQERVGFRLQPPRPLRWRPVDDHLGWHEQGDGLHFYGLYVENGRIADTPGRALRTGLRRLVETLRPSLRITPQQNLILCNIAPAERATVMRLLDDHGIAASESLPNALRHSMACPAVPTCGLAVAEAERVMPKVIREIASLLGELGLDQERISVRMTGCPNGCARPYLGDIGFVGTTLGKYDLYLGGDFEGTRLNALYAHNVLLEDLAASLRGPLTAFRDERRDGEGFGDWCHRIGIDAIRERIARRLAVA
jgi:sulfite reductase (ferredoxin)